jgi:hypothetical protein
MRAWAFEPEWDLHPEIEPEWDSNSKEWFKVIPDGKVNGNGTSQNVPDCVSRKADSKDDNAELVAHKILVALEPFQRQIAVLNHADNNAEAAIADLTRQFEALKKVVLHGQRQRLLYQAFLRV